MPRPILINRQPLVSQYRTTPWDLAKILYDEPTGEMVAKAKALRDAYYKESTTQQHEE